MLSCTNTERQIETRDVACCVHGVSTVFLHTRRNQNLFLIQRPVVSEIQDYNLTIPHLGLQIRIKTKRSKISPMYPCFYTLLSQNGHDFKAAQDFFIVQLNFVIPCLWPNLRDVSQFSKCPYVNMDLDQGKTSHCCMISTFFLPHDSRN